MLIVFLGIFLFILFYRMYFHKPPQKPEIHRNGFEVLTDVFTENEVNLLLAYTENNENAKAVKYITESSALLSKLYEKLGPEYVFLDYSFILKKSQLSSCHRDDNGTMTNKNSIKPSYTMIVFLKPMETCLKVIDKSHIKKEKTYITQPSDNIKCKPGQVILFDSNTIHAGAINKRIDNTRIQLKLVHVLDYNNHQNLENFHKELNHNKEPTFFGKYIDTNISCTFPFFSDEYRFEKNKATKMYERLIYKDNLKL